MKKVSKLGWPLALILAFSLLAIVGCTPPPSPSPTSIAEIKANPAEYEGKMVTISGEYQGWKGEYGSPPVTRSDWVVKDETGWIYVTGKSSGLDPMKDVEEKIEVTGKVAKNKQVYIKAERIKVKREK